MNMKTIHKILCFSIALAMTGLTACEKNYETDDLSQITNYPVFEMTGASVVLAKLGEPYVDQGCTATEGDAEITVTMSVKGLFSGFSGTAPNTDQADKYVITYTATNSDGFANTVQRIVWVAGEGDLTSSIEGLYLSTVVRNGASGAQYTNMQYVLIWKKNGNVYEISDAIGGYYDIGRAYGDGYRAAGMTITANNIPANDFSFGGPIGVGAFGGVLTMDAMAADAGAGTIGFTSSWDAGYTFVVTLTQVEL
jgi:hypothetical protein